MEEEREVKKLDDKIDELQLRRQIKIFHIKSLRVEMVSLEIDSIVVLSTLFFRE